MAERWPLSRLLAHCRVWHVFWIFLPVSGATRRWVLFIVAVGDPTDHLSSAQESRACRRPGRFRSWVGPMAGGTRCEVPRPHIACRSLHRLPGPTHTSVAAGRSGSDGVDRWRDGRGGNSDVDPRRGVHVSWRSRKCVQLGRDSSRWSHRQSDSRRVGLGYQT